ncbi:hypothetical protein TIFTF001_033410 [Ficus carica]|uniref:Uncharacterized protein n=1 Tax=Ficus carica TaxID=3494 RepID=A0AA88E589_FICCA|nr:hypothetical protein TIFTF001_033410 [Ficus carica]
MLRPGHPNYTCNDAGVCAVTATATGVVWERMVKGMFGTF